MFCALRVLGNIYLCTFHNLQLVLSLKLYLDVATIILLAGMAEEFWSEGIAVNALWPKTTVYTAAMEMLGGGPAVAKGCRTPQIMADAAYVILTKDSESFTGKFAVDEDILRAEGCTDFSTYLAPGAKESNLILDGFLESSNYDATLLEGNVRNPGMKR